MTMVNFPPILQSSMIVDKIDRFRQSTAPKQDLEVSLETTSVTINAIDQEWNDDSYYIHIIESLSKAQPKIERVKPGRYEELKSKIERILGQRQVFFEDFSTNIFPSMMSSLSIPTDVYSLICGFLDIKEDARNIKAMLGVGYLKQNPERIAQTISINKWAICSVLKCFGMNENSDKRAISTIKQNLTYIEIDDDEFSDLGLDPDDSSMIKRLNDLSTRYPRAIEFTATRSNIGTFILNIAKFQLITNKQVQLAIIQAAEDHIKMLQLVSFPIANPLKKPGVLINLARALFANEKNKDVGIEALKAWHRITKEYPSTSSTTELTTAELTTEERTLIGIAS